MASGRFGRVVGLGLASMAAAALAACGVINPPVVPSSSGGAQVVPAVAQAGPTVAAKPANGAGSSRSATVKVDTIVETMSLDGLIAAQEQVPITYAGRGQVADIKVKSGQVVGQGDVLVELDSAELVRSLDASKVRLDTSMASLAQAQAQAAADLRAATQRLAANQSQQQLAIADAEAGLRKAQDQLSAVMAGASDSDRRAAQSAVTTAQAVVQKALAAQDKLSAGPDPATLRAAKLDQGNAQVGVDRAQADLDALVKGADPMLLGQAQRELDRAQTQLQLAQSAKPDPKADPNVAKLARDSAIADASLAVQTAQDRLAKLKQPPSNIDVQTAKLRVQTARDVLAVATDKLSALQAPPDQLTLDAAQAAVDAAEQGVADAQAKLVAVNNRPSVSEVTDAQAAVRRAQAGLDAARSPALQADADPRGVDLAAVQEAVNRDQAEVAKVEKQIQDTRLTAPFAGTVLSVRVKIGEPLTSSKAVVVLAKQGQAIVRAQLGDDQVARLALGQTGDLVLDGAAATDPKISATVASITPAAKDGSSFATADFTIAWPDGPTPKIGVPVQVAMTLQKKQGVLVVPKNAIHQSGNRRYVEVLDGALRRVTNVVVGITSTDTVEVVSGLSEGQVVLLTS